MLAGLDKNLRDFGLSVGLAIGLFETMIREPAALLMEELVTGGQCLQKLRIAGDVASGNEAKGIEPLIEAVQVLDSHGFVRSVGGQNLGRKGSIIAKLLMILQVVKWIVGSADYPDVHLGEDFPGGKLVILEEFRTAIEDLVGAVAVEQDITYPKRFFQLQVGPVVEWISECAWYGGCPGLELFSIGGISGDIVLVDAVGSHCPPLIVIAVKPDGGQVVEFFIVGDFPHRQEAEII